MTTFADVPAQTGNFLARTEDWLDARGRWAWIGAMVTGFILFWPVGLALLAVMLMRGKFHGASQATVRVRSGRDTGNAAFDAYRNDTLRRLEEEQEAFENFIKRLREARDKAEFDQFMADRGAERDSADRVAA